MENQGFKVSNIARVFVWIKSSTRNEQLTLHTIARWSTTGHDQEEYHKENHIRGRQLNWNRLGSPPSRSLPPRARGVRRPHEPCRLVGNDKSACHLVCHHRMLWFIHFHFGLFVCLQTWMLFSNLVASFLKLDLDPVHGDLFQVSIKSWLFFSFFFFPNESWSPMSLNRRGSNLTIPNNPWRLAIDLDSKRANKQAQTDFQGTRFKCSACVGSKVKMENARIERKRQKQRLKFSQEKYSPREMERRRDNHIKFNTFSGLRNKRRTGCWRGFSFGDKLESYQFTINNFPAKTFLLLLFLQFD